MLYVGTGSEVNSFAVESCMAGFEIMRREIVCESVTPFSVSTRALMWHDSNAAEKMLGINGPGIRIADDLGCPSLEHFPDRVIRGAIFLTGPSTGTARFTSLPRGFYEHFMRLLLGL